MKKKISIIITLSLIISLISIPVSASAGMGISKKKATMEIDSTLILKVDGLKKGTEVKWTTNKKSIATVGAKTGNVTAKSEGNATITATVGTKKYTCTVKVVNSNKVKATPTPKPTPTTPSSKNSDKSSDLKYYTKYPSVPIIANIKGLTYWTTSSENNKTIVNYEYDSSKTTSDEILRKYSDILYNEGFKYDDIESHYYNYERHEGDELVESSESWSKIVYYDELNKVKITAMHEISTSLTVYSPLIKSYISVIMESIDAPDNK